MINTTEKQLKENFMEHYFDAFKKLVGQPNLRIYGIETPLRTKDGIKKADIILIIENGELFYDQKMIVMEWKKTAIDYGPIDQLHMYVEYTKKQFYRTKPVSGFLVAPRFSNHEINQCKKYGYHALQFDEKGNMRILV